MAHLETNEEDGEKNKQDNELIEWLTKNKLSSVHKHLANLDVSVSMDELREMATETSFLTGFITNDLKLDGIVALKFRRAVQALKPSQHKETKIIRTVILTKIEGDAIKNLKNKCSAVLSYINQLENDINLLNDALLTNKNDINSFRKESINKINSRMDSLILESEKSINNKKENILSTMNNAKIYYKSLSEAKNKQNELLNDDNLDDTKREMKIIEISRNILKNEKNDILNNKPNIKALVTTQFNKTRIFDEINKFGEIISYNHPNPPILSVKNIDITTATIECNALNKNNECHIEMNDGDDNEDDEKKSNWKQVATLTNKTVYLFSKLKDDKLYKIRAKCKNEFGCSKYSEIISFKTKKHLIDSVILSKDEQNLLLRLMNKSGQNFTNKKWKLLFRASRDGWSGSHFHKHSDNKPNTVSIIHTKTNNVFGAYTSIPWNGERDNAYDKDDKAFLILLRSSKKYTPNIFKVKNSEYAVEHYKSQMCKFGSGHDIKIVSNCNTNKSSYTSASSYDIPKPYYLNGDEKNFTVHDVETYCLT